MFNCYNPIGTHFHIESTHFPCQYPSSLPSMSRQIWFWTSEFIPGNLQLKQYPKIYLADSFYRIKFTNGLLGFEKTFKSDSVHVFSSYEKISSQFAKKLSNFSIEKKLSENFLLVKAVHGAFHLIFCLFLLIHYLEGNSEMSRQWHGCTNKQLSSQNLMMSKNFQYTNS